MTTTTMGEFRDHKGRTWSLRVTCSEMWLVREKVGVDLLNPEQFRAAVSDPVTLARCAFRCVGNETQGCDEHGFLGAIWGDVIDDVGRAFSQAISRFFPSRVGQAATTTAADATERSSPRNGAALSGSAGGSSG